MPNRTKDVPGYTYRGADDRHGSICVIMGQVHDEDILCDQGPCYKVLFADGATRLVAAIDLTPWFKV